MDARRRTLIRAAARGAAWASAAVLAGCGFKLRTAPDFAFKSIRLAAPPGSALALELQRQLAASGKLQVLSAQQPDDVEVTLDVLREQREKVVAGVNASGQVREFQLRLRLQFRLRGRDGRELVEPTELLQQRDMSFSETVALAKEAEEALLYRDMQADLVRQLMRRLAALRTV
ncbi:MAG: LPS assembly lipoprotein LptE [Burkholderiaceae bacterium]